jgi:hypothetical protein
VALRGESPFTVGAAGVPRVLVCIEGAGQSSTAAPLMPSEKATYFCRRLPGPRNAVSLLEIAYRNRSAGQQRFAGETCWKSRYRDGMKKLIVFDLDGTLAESKSSLDAEMSALLHDLLGVVKVAVISGGDWPQFEKQVLSHLPHDERLTNLSLLPTCGTKFFQYSGDWKKIYSEDFTADEKEKIVSSLKKAVEQAGFKVEKVWGEVIEDRGSQITFPH